MKKITCKKLTHKIVDISKQNIKTPAEFTSIRTRLTSYPNY